MTLATLGNDGSQTDKIETRTRSGNTASNNLSTPDLLRDFFKPEKGFDTVGLELDGLAAGTYDITTWHTGVAFGHDQTHDIRVTDANRIDVSVGTVTQIGDTQSGTPAVTSDTIASLTYQVESNGTDPVLMEFTSDEDNTVAHFESVNGFTIAAVPEPQSFALIGGLLALGAVMLRRRARG